jgi:YesN/AraC family two-component response regulator
VVAEATNGEEALELSSRHLPDVLLLDLRMPKKDGLQVMAEISRHCHEKRTSRSG